MQNKDDNQFGKELIAAILLFMLLSMCFRIFSGNAYAECATPTDLAVPATQSVMPTAAPTAAQSPRPAKRPENKDPSTCTVYKIPKSVLAADPAFAAIIQEAEKYIGYPYVYGGSTPEKGFDCSGFVCWVYRKSGVCDTGRKGANGLKKMCSDVPPGQARPGDLIFFTNTMGPEVKGITHVGIYVGNDWMLHCGDPIQYVDLSADLKWAERFHSFGRLSYEGVYQNDPTEQ